MNIRFFLFIPAILFSQSAFAESYKTFVDLYGHNTVALTISYATGKAQILTDEITVNGQIIAEVKSAVMSENSYKIIASDGTVILSIPASAEKSEWSMQDNSKNFFTDGDSRILKGKIILNGKEEEKVLEISAEE